MRFVRKVDLYRFIKKRTEKRKINSTNLGFKNNGGTPIYANNSLALAIRKLLNEAYAIKQQKQYTFLWVKGGCIFMRKDPGDPFVTIKSAEDLKTVH